MSDAGSDEPAPLGARPAAPAPAQPFSLRRIALSAFAPTLLFGLGEGAILPVVALAARDLGASVAAAAGVVTLIGIGSLVSNVPASLVTMRFGERAAVVAAALWCALAMAICAWTRQFTLFAAGCFMIGMAQAVFNLARQSYLTEAVPVAYRARALSTLGGVMRIGMFIGPLVGAAAIHRFGLGGAFAVGIVALLLAGLVAARVPDLPAHEGDALARAPAADGAAAQTAAAVATSRPDTRTTPTTPGAPAAPTVMPPPAPAAPGWWGTVRAHRPVFVTLGVGVMLIAAVRATRQAVIPLWAEHLALEPSMASLIYGLAAGVDMLMFYPAGRVMDRKGRLWVALPSMLIMGVALLLTPLSGGALTLLLAASAIGLGNGIGSGLIMTLGADHSPRAGRAHFLGVWRLLADIGAACGPVLLSFLTAALSLAAGIAVTGVVAFAAAAQLGYWLPRVKAPPH